MSGDEIYNIISNHTYNKVVFEFTKVLKDEPCSETVAVGCQLILVDIDLIQGCDNAEALRIEVLNKAEAEGSYAGMEYVECEMLEPDHEMYEEADGGLQWADFDVLWNALETACKELVAV